MSSFVDIPKPAMSIILGNLDNANLASLSLVCSGISKDDCMAHQIQTIKDAHSTERKRLERLKLFAHFGYESQHIEINFNRRLVFVITPEKQTMGRQLSLVFDVVHPGSTYVPVYFHFRKSFEHVNANIDLYKFVAKMALDRLLVLNAESIPFTNELSDQVLNTITTEEYFNAHSEAIKLLQSILNVPTPVSAVGGRNKNPEQVKYQSKCYNVLKDGRRKYIMVRKAPVYLSEIRGKYSMATI